MRVGLFFPMEPERRGPREQYRFIVDATALAEELGYSGVWLASRHFSPSYAAVPSPLVLLSAAAARTERIELGTSVVTLPLENPIRLAEDFATLDAISAGRARLGVGSGDDPPAFEAFGVPFDKRQPTLSEELPKLIDLLEGEPVGGLKLFPEVADARSKLALGVQSAGGARWAGSLGIGILQGRSEPRVEDPTGPQNEAAAAYRKVNPGGSIRTARNAWVGTADDAPLVEAMRRHNDYLEGRGRQGLPAESTQALKKMNIFVGSAEEVADRIKASVAPIAPDELLLTVDPGGLGSAEIEKRLVAFAEAFALT